MRKVIVVAVVFFATAAHARTYTDEQLTLATEIGTLISLARACPSTEMPVAGVEVALQAVGLGRADFIEHTAFRAKVDERTRAFVEMYKTRLRLGETRSAIEADLCAILQERYGPNGTVLPGILDVR